MGKADRFPRGRAAEAADAPGRRAAARLARGLPAVRAAGARGADGALHGLRHSVLPQRLSARQPDSELERSRLSRSLAGGDRSAARDQQFSGVHRTAVSRRRAKASCVLGINDAPVTIKATEAAIVDRAFSEGWIDRAAAGAPHRQARRRRRLRAGRPRRGGSVEPRRPHRDGLRARRSHRRPAALRHPGVQAREAGARSPAGADGGRRHRVSHGLPGRHRSDGRRSAVGLRRRRPGGRHRPCRAICACPGAISTASTSRWTT